MRRRAKGVNKKRMLPTQTKIKLTENRIKALKGDIHNKEVEISLLQEYKDRLTKKGKSS